MATYLLSLTDADEAAAARAEDFANRASAMVAMGLVDYHFDGYQIENFGFGRGTSIVTVDAAGRLHCSTCDALCVHVEAVKLFIAKALPVKPPPPPPPPVVEDGEVLSIVNRYTAKTMRALITPKQLVAIRIVAQSMGMDARKLSHERYGCDYERLSIYWAGQFYQSLLKMRADSREAMYGR